MFNFLDVFFSSCIVDVVIGDVIVVTVVLEEFIGSFVVVTIFILIEVVGMWVLDDIVMARVVVSACVIVEVIVDALDGAGVVVVVPNLLEEVLCSCVIAIVLLFVSAATDIWVVGASGVFKSRVDTCESNVVVVDMVFIDCVVIVSVNNFGVIGTSLEDVFVCSIIDNVVIEAFGAD